MSLDKIAPAPWLFDDAELLGQADNGNIVVDVDSGDDIEPEMTANGRLIAAAPDHALILYALTCGLARWESSRGQLVVVQRYGEEQYATTIDEFGCPKVSPIMRDALARAVRP